MATKLTTSTLKVSVTETITLNGRQQGSSSAFFVPNIATVSRRFVDVPTSEIILASFSTAVSAGTYIESDVMYIRITNLDDKNFVYLVF